MNNDSEYIIANIDFTMSMEDLPLTEENKDEMRKCIDGKLDLDKLIEETIRKWIYQASETKVLIPREPKYKNKQRRSPFSYLGAPPRPWRTL